MKAKTNKIKSKVNNIQRFKPTFNKLIKEAKNNDPKVLYNLGLCYHLGFGTKKNYKKARYYYELAIKLGCTDAKFFLAQLYEQGLGVKKDLVKAGILLAEIFENEENN